MKQFYLKSVINFLLLSVTFLPVTHAQITTVFGRHTYLGDGSIAVNAGLFKPYGMAMDDAGNIYVACQGDNRVRKIAASTGIITTVAGTGVSGYNGDGIPAATAQLNFKNGLPGLAVDNKGNLYIGDYGNNRIRKIVLSTGIITTVAGNGVGGYTGDGGAATAAKMSGPAGVVADTVKGVIYFADNNNCAIREINTATGIITTVAGNGTPGYGGDGSLATAATLNYPERFAFDKKGNMYIADEFNFVVRKVDVSTKKISTVAGTGGYGFSGDGGLAANATFSALAGIAIDTSGNIYVSDQANARIRKIDASSQKIATVAGTGVRIYNGDGIAATSANIYGAAELVVDNSFNIYIADAGNNRLRKVTAASLLISTVAGDGTDGFTGAPDALKAQLNPQDVVADASGNFYIADGYYYDVRAVNVANSSYIYAGSPNPDPAAASKGYAGNGGLASQAKFNTPVSIAVDASNNIYIADVFNNVVRKITYNNKVIANIAGNNTTGYSGDGSVATSAQLNNPWGIALDKSGNLYIADALNNVVRRVDASTQKISTVAGNNTAGSSGDGGAATSARLNFPYAVAVDTAGNIFIVDKNNNSIRKVNAATQKITTIFNNGHVLTAVATDISGNIFVSDSTANTIVRIDRNNYGYQVIAGNGTKGYSGDGGAAKSAALNNPRGLYIDAAGHVYVADAGNNVVRKIIMGVLPVTLADFTAAKTKNSVLLQWVTSTETNNNRFIIERSSSGAEWKDIASINGYGTSSIQHSYAFTDQTPLAGYNYYRLKQVDADGSYTFSGVRTVIFEGILSARAYPNPFKDYCTIEVISNDAGKAVVSVYTLDGRKVIAAAQQLVTGLNKITLPQLGGLSKGAYLVRITTTGGTFDTKIVK
ncbi:MAG TPA: T9SS type A sorting domain-containing protein [Chitinophagaceae bacterium]|nr:T9SS type A sorting domain-containing protein [Chitinophagaceae bacterium]